MRTYLLIHRVPVTKDEVSSNKAGDKGISTALFSTIEFPLKQQDRLVEGYEFGKV